MSHFFFAKRKIGQALLIAGGLLFIPSWGYAQEGALIKGLRRVIKSSKPLEQPIVKGIMPLTEDQIKKAVNAAILTNAAKDPNLAEMAASGLIEKNHISVPNIEVEEHYSVAAREIASVASVKSTAQPKMKIEPPSVMQEKVTQEKYKLWEKYGEATLIRAAQEGMLYSVQFMVQQGAEITDDILFAARDSRNIDLLKYVVGIKGATRATLQATWTHPELLAELLKQPVFIDNMYFYPGSSGVSGTTKDQRGTLLYFAASYAHPKSVEMLCSFFQPNREVADLMLSRALFEPTEDRLEVALMLIKQFGADPTPAISYVAGNALYSWVSPLKEAGANANFADKRGNTPLHNAVTAIPYKRNCEDYIKTVEVLLQNGADPLLPNANGKSALLLMQERLRDMQKGAAHYYPDRIEALERTIRLLETALPKK